jgi:hypothetical protein
MSQTSQDVRYAVEAEVNCQTLYVRLRALAAGLIGGGWEGDASVCSSLVGTMRRLRSDLQAHHDAVRGHDGLLRCISAECPRLSIGADRLLEQHEALLGQLSVLEAALIPGPMAGSSPQSRNVRHLARRLVRTMQVHQHQGNALILEAYSADTGMGAGD